MKNYVVRYNNVKDDDQIILGVWNDTESDIKSMFKAIRGKIYESYNDDELDYIDIDNFKGEKENIVSSFSLPLDYRKRDKKELTVDMGINDVEKRLLERL